MWGDPDGKRIYWRRKEEGGGGGATVGIVVIYAWMSSRERQVKAFVELYASLGWSSVVCHSNFPSLYFPEKAMRLADRILHELVKEIKIRPLPIIFAAFSGGPKACMYKVFQLMEGKCEGQHNLAEYKLVKNCVCGQIYDSTPVDFTSDLAIRAFLHPTVIKIAHPPKVLSWMANAIASGFDAFNKFEKQRPEYWQTLYSSVAVGPFLILCSENDDLAPYPIIANFAQRLQELGGDVRVVKWKDSPHVGHYKHHTADYKAAVTELLGKALFIYSQRRQVNGEAAGTASPGKISKSVLDGHKAAGTASPGKISKSVLDGHKAAVNSNESLKRVAAGPSDHFFLPCSMEYEGTRDTVSMQGEHKPDLIRLQNTLVIKLHGVLGRILFDVCVPKNVEGWDMKPLSTNSRQAFSSARQHGLLNPIKCIRRSRL